MGNIEVTIASLPAGPALDYLVATAKLLNLPTSDADVMLWAKRVKPSTSGDAIVAIMDGYGIGVVPTGDSDKWEARWWQDQVNGFVLVQGNTPREAVCRAFAQMRLGSTWTVPRNVLLPGW